MESHDLKVNYDSTCPDWFYCSCGHVYGRVLPVEAQRLHLEHIEEISP